MASGPAASCIGITVEGANILTRTLIVYGQGALRCHPYVQREVAAAEAGDSGALLSALLGHAVHAGRNLGRALLLTASRGWLARAPVSGPTARYYRRLAWACALLATLSELAMASLGGTLKRRGKLTGRFADLLSWIYLGFCALRRFEAEGRPESDLPLVRFAAEWSLHQAQIALDGILANLATPLLAPLRLWLRASPLGAPPSDALGAQVAALLRTPCAARDRLTAGISIPDDPTLPLGRRERALALAVQAEPIEERLRAAQRRGALPEATPAAGLAAGLISAAEAGLLTRARLAREDACAVDTFSPAEYFGAAGVSEPELTAAR
jgi:acyl-CoA dehydrogenase